MPTFVLKKYEPTDQDKGQISGDHTNQSANQQAEKMEEKAQMIEVSASDSISKIVAQALYKAMPNIDITERVLDEEQAKKEDSQDGATKVVSAEEINRCPVDALASLGSSKCVLILNDGFKTAQEEWFLTTLQNRGIKTFYTIGSFVKYVQKTLV